LCKNLQCQYSRKLNYAGNVKLAIASLAVSISYTTIEVSKNINRINKLMINTHIENQVRYVTNVDGKTTDVLVPLELWQQLINSINSDHVSGLAWIDEQEPKAQILADLQESIAQVAAGQTFPVSELWDDINP